MGIHSPHHCPYCHKNPTARCVELKHVYNCPRHPEAYCLDENDRTCVLCEQFYEREEREIQKENRLVQEAIVAAALASRAETCKAGKVQWGTKLPTAGKLARTAALKAREASKRTDAGERQSGQAQKVWKGPKGGKLRNSAATPYLQDDETPKNEQQKSNGKPKLRIQRGR